ncbi:hypothetical protein GCK72_021997 [Caenorhabditis remanei]|uniref:T20D4.11-like domain-containing protein n=1 Tax=Caenorhabditis remanei TaxID=31234 RepID=A0A6A5GJL1_CAERE|nr:hypothetical protein GCK72_021997 [Caenorhabditis remanei]KAF1755428.1 hypothetical protein GCK72_021997 [Caenorhabditis remanei]
MAGINFCGWITAFVCCVLCSGMMCFLIFGTTVFITFMALFTAINECPGPDLIAAQSCVPLVGQLANVTIQFEPRFGDEGSEQMKEVMALCENVTHCIKDVNCLTFRIGYLRSGKICEVFAFINEEFGQCAGKLKKKAYERNIDCLKFLFQNEEKCEGWAEHQKCIDEEVLSDCGSGMSERFKQISKDFMFGTCTTVEKPATSTNNTSQ